LPAYQKRHCSYCLSLNPYLPAIIHGFAKNSSPPEHLLFTLLLKISWPRKFVLLSRNQAIAGFTAAERIHHIHRLLNGRDRYVSETETCSSAILVIIQLAVVFTALLRSRNPDYPLPPSPLLFQDAFLFLLETIFFLREWTIVEDELGVTCRPRGWRLDYS
jgi:hypothetical protein